MNKRKPVSAAIVVIGAVWTCALLVALVLPFVMNR